MIWSTTIGKIVHGHSIDSRFFLLFIFPFVASPFSLFCFWKLCICSAKGDTPWTPFFFFPPSFFAFLCFSSLFFFLSCFLLFVMKFQFFFVFSLELSEHCRRNMCTIEIIDREFVGCNCPITERKMFFFCIL